MYGISSTLYANYKGEAEDILEKIESQSQRNERCSYKDSVLLVQSKTGKDTATMWVMRLCVISVKEERSIGKKGYCFITLNVDKNMWKRMSFINTNK
jgi:hypothetical protein